MTLFSAGIGEYVASESHHLGLPNLWKSNGTARGCMYAPGLGGTIPAINGSDGTYMADRGVAIGTFDFGMNDEWGNATSDSRMDSAWAFCKSRFGFKTDKVLLFGISHGGVTVLNWAKANPTLVAAIALGMPAVSPQDIYDFDRGTLQSEIAAAYGGGRPPDSRDPTKNAASFVGIPIAIWYSTDDPICTAATVTAFGTAVGAEMNSLGAVGHSLTGLDMNDPCDFLLEHA